MRMKVIPATRRHPEPALALRLYDQNGKNAGLALVSLVASSTGRLTQGETRMLATEGAQGAILQRSESGDTRIVGSFSEALDTVRHYPQDGVVWQTSEIRPSSSLLKLTRGAVPELDVRSVLSAVNQDIAITLPDIPVNRIKPEMGIPALPDSEHENEAADKIIDIARNTVQKAVPENADIQAVLLHEGDAGSSDAQNERDSVKSASDLISPPVTNAERVLAERQEVSQVAGELADRDAADVAGALRENGKMSEINEPDIAKTIQKER